MHIGQVFVTRGNRNCCPLPSGTPGNLSCTTWQMFRDEKDHPASLHCMAPHCLCMHGEESEEWLGTSIRPTVCTFRLPSVRVHEGSDARPALEEQWGSLGSHPSLFMNGWNRVLSSRDLCTSRMVAKMHQLWWRLCREVNTLHRLDWQVMFSYSYINLKVKLICSWLLVQPIYYQST